MSLFDFVQEAEKNASEETSEQEYTDEEIKEAYAAGRIAGAAYRDELNKLAQQAKKDEMGVAHKDNEGSDQAKPEKSEGGEATVDQKRKDINQDQKAVKNTNNDQDPNAVENAQETDGPEPGDTEDNKDHSVEAAAKRVLDALNN